jgi:hypothetical protein
MALFRPARLLRRPVQWRQLRPVLDADADRADLELRLIKLLLKDRARVHPLPATAAHADKVFIQSLSVSSEGDHNIRWTNALVRHATRSR